MRRPLARIEGDSPGDYVEIHQYSERVPDSEPAPAPPEDPPGIAAIVAWDLVTGSGRPIR